MKSLNKPLIPFVVQSNNTIIMYQNGNIFYSIYLPFTTEFLGPEQVRGTADVFYLRPNAEPLVDNSIWYSKDSLSPTIIDQILNRLKLLPEFYNETKPVETGSTSSTGNNSVTSTTGTTS